MNGPMHDQSTPSEAPLQSWKEIAAHLQRDVTTAQRWEKEEGLPVHRHSHKRRASVYAYPSEIDAWKGARRLVSEPPPPLPLWKTLLSPPRSLAFGVTLALCLLMVGNGIRPLEVAAQQVDAPKTTRQVWVNRPSAWPESLSPDGRYFSFTDWTTGDLAVHDLIAGTNRRLTNMGDITVHEGKVGPNPGDGEYGESEFSVFSPDGRWIAYNWNAPHNELRIISFDGGKPRSIPQTNSPEFYYQTQAWTPDGNSLLVVQSSTTGSRIGILSIDDGTFQPLKSFPWTHVDATLSPDGKWISYASPPDSTTPANDIFLLAVDGTREVTAVKNPANDIAPAWSPDGKQLVFLSDRSGPPAVWSLSIEGGKPGNEELIKADVGKAQRLFAAPDGTLYYFGQGQGGPNIYSIPLDADGAVTGNRSLVVDTFVNSNNLPDLSPDGTSIAYYSNRGKLALVIRTLGTGEERVVPVEVPIFASFAVGPRWFPDGRSILLLSEVPRGSGPNFYRVDVATGKAERLLNSKSNVLGFKLSADGNTIFYSEPKRLMRVDLATRRETELLTGGNYFDISLSPDEEHVAYAAMDRTNLATPYIGIVPAAGGPSRELFRGQPLEQGPRYAALSWTPDSRYVLFPRPGEKGPAELMRLPLTGGAPESMNLSAPALQSFTIDPSRGRLLFAANDAGPNELWALENFLSSRN